MRERLLHDLPGVFDRDPDSVLALRLYHPDGLRWTVAATTLTLIPGAGPEQTYTLTGITLHDLATTLAADAIQITYQNSTLNARPATLLIPGQGAQDGAADRQRDGLYAFQSILWAHLTALGQELTQADAALAALLRQLILPQAREDWADVWGDYFGVPRRTGESDPDYTQRIIAEFYRARNNPAAILGNIQRLTGEQLTLREPWRELHLLSISALSGPDHLQGAPIYQYHTMQLVARRGPHDWAPILREAHADRPAGTLLLDPATHPPAFQTEGWLDDLIITGSRWDWRSEHLYHNTYGRLSINLNLSNDPPPPLQPQAARSDVRLLFTLGLRGPDVVWTDQTLGWYGAWDIRQWAMQPPTHELYPPKTFAA